MSRLPIRARLTVAFAVAMAAVLAIAGGFVYLRLDSDLTETVDEALVARASAVAPAGAGSGSPEPAPAAPGDADEGFAQIVDGERVLTSTGGAGEPVLSAEEVADALEGPAFYERDVDGVDGTTRVLALPAPGGSEPLALVVGQSLEDRDETLANLVAAFAVGGPLAVLLASLIGYALASAGLRPVEAIRRRAGEVSLERDGELLPLPAANDEIRRLAETLNAMLARLRDSFERERRFVADASHELRTPIAVVKSELDAALRSGDVGPAARVSVVAAIEECDRLAHLAEDLLVLARSSDGALPVRPEPIGAAALLEGIQVRFAERARERGRGIRVEAGGDVEIDADPLRVRQAIANLVDNALRHGEGEIVLAARRDADGVEIEVSDQGPGFDPLFAARAFERFSRGDAARTRGGAGLGLAIVRAIADAHGGSAEIVAREAGATVCLRFPSQGHLSGEA